MTSITKKTKNILIILALLLLAVVGATIAYFTSRTDFKNEFHVSKPGAAVVERFNPADHWVPGEEKSKEIWFVNSGEADMLLRFKVDASWAEGYEPKNAAGEKVDPLPDIWEKNIITLNWNGGGGDKTADDGSIKNFRKITDSAGTYYYYTRVLKAGESTDKVLESVTFSSSLSNDDHTGINYSESQINLTITGETVLADPDAALELWKIKAGIDAENNVAWTAD